MSKELWFDARGLKEADYDKIDAAAQRDYKAVLINEEQIGVRLSDRIKKAVFIQKRESLKNLSEKSIAVFKDNKFSAEYKGLKDKGIELAFYINVIDKDSMEAAANVSSIFNYVIVDFKDDTNIPLELILAKQQNKKISVLKIVPTAQEGIIAMGVMESGSDGVILCTDSIVEISELALRRNEMSYTNISLKEAEIIEIQHIGMGERACIDTTSILNEGEGILVGSTSTGGLLMCAEVYYLPYMNTRPFRVNAGAVHSYVWGPDNIVEYLSDLRAGSKVISVSTEGIAREVNVGRIKTEIRPLLLIRAKTAENEINVIVQDDWHIRVYGADKKVLHVTELKKGTKVLAYTCEPGRHVGVKIDETILER